MTKIEIDIDIGDHERKVVEKALEITLKRVTEHQFTNSDDADSISDLQNAYVKMHKLNYGFFE